MCIYCMQLTFLEFNRPDIVIKQTVTCFSVSPGYFNSCSCVHLGCSFLFCIVNLCFANSRCVFSMCGGFHKLVVFIYSNECICRYVADILTYMSHIWIHLVLEVFSPAFIAFLVTQVLAPIPPSLNTYTRHINNVIDWNNSTAGYSAMQVVNMHFHCTSIFCPLHWILLWILFLWCVTKQIVFMLASKPHRDIHLCTMSVDVWLWSVICILKLLPRSCRSHLSTTVSCV